MVGLIYRLIRDGREEAPLEILTWLWEIVRFHWGMKWVTNGIEGRGRVVEKVNCSTDKLVTPPTIRE